MAKIRGNVRLTTEFLKDVLGLPEEVEVLRVDTEPKREIVNVIITSPEPIAGYTQHIAESSEIVMWGGYPDVDMGEIPEAWFRIYEKVRNHLAGTEEGEGEL